MGMNRGDTRGLGSLRDAQAAARGCFTDTPACTAAAKCRFAFATRAEASSSFRSPVEIPQRCQHRGLQRPANLPRPSEGLGCCHLGAASLPGLLGRIIWSREAGGELSWGCTCPLAAPCPRLAGCVIPCVFFQAPLPSFEWALPARPRNLPLSGTADERCDKFRKKSLCGSEEKHGSLGNPSCSEVV